MNKRISFASLLVLITALPACNWFGSCCNQPVVEKEAVEVKEELPLIEEAVTPEASTALEEAATSEKI